MHAIGDAVMNRLGFGTPIANVERLKMQREARDMAAQEMDLRTRNVERAEAEAEAEKVMPSLLLAVSKPGSPYYRDLTHLARGVNANEKTQRFFGGKVDIKRLDEADEGGSPYFQIDTLDPATGAVLFSTKATTEQAIDQFDATLDPKPAKAVRDATRALHASQEATVEKLRKYGDADWATKEAMGIKTTPLDKFLYLKNNLPAEMQGKVSDWQLKEAAGFKDDDRWQVVGGGYLPMPDGSVGIAMRLKGTDRIETRKVPGVTWDELKTRGGGGGSEKDIRAAINEIWPETDMTDEPEAKSRGVFMAELRAAEGNEKKRDLLRRVLPDFQEWAETYDPAATGGKFSSKAARAKLVEMMKSAGGEAGAAPGPQDDQGDMGYYDRQSKNRQARNKEWRDYLTGNSKIATKPGEKPPMDEFGRTFPLQGPARFIK